MALRETVENHTLVLKANGKILSIEATLSEALVKVPVDGSGSTQLLTFGDTYTDAAGNLVKHGVTDGLTH
ncbi:MAG: hypothetical protein AAB430_01895 [Patescibacteria group bacterium]